MRESDVGVSGIHANIDTTSKKNVLAKKDLVFLTDSSIFLVFKYALGWRLETGFIDL